MQDLPRQKLVEIMARFGPQLCDDPKRCEGLLRDYCGDHKREITILVAAIRERVTVELRDWRGTIPRDVLLERCAQRLHSNFGMVPHLARWSVETWALAFGILAPNEPEQPPAAGQPRVPASATRVLPGKDTLAAAVAAAADGSTLVLAPGEFRLSRTLVVAKSLSIHAEQPGASRLVSDSGRQALRLTGNAAWVLRGLQCEFRGREGDVLRVDQGRVEIDGCEFTGGREENAETGRLGAGICITGTAEATITNCRAHGNAAGILFEGQSKGLARRNICQKNRYHGIGAADGAQPTLEENQCLENERSGMVYFGNSSGLARRNICQKNKLCGIWVGGQAQPTLEENQCLENQLGDIAGKKPSVLEMIKKEVRGGGGAQGRAPDGAMVGAMVGAFVGAAGGAWVGPEVGVVVGALVEAFGGP